MRVQGVILIFCAITVVVSSLEKKGRGEPCELLKSEPDGRNSEVCDDRRGLTCLLSYNPGFVRNSWNPKPKCDCAEDYYYDELSEECRIQIGYPCDPEKANSGEESWSKKCPGNGFCSRDVGRYGPLGAKGMCRCKEGYYVESVWFTEGGGTVCKREDEDSNNGLQDYTIEQAINFNILK